jgi:hypothetical protein
MNENDRQFEDFLREFKPRRPRALPDDRAIGLHPRRLAAAAVLVVSLGSMSWFAFKNKRPTTPQLSSDQLTYRQGGPPKLTLIQWTRLAEQDPKALETTLDEASRKSLPGFNDPNSSLRVLAKP